MSDTLATLSVEQLSHAVNSVVSPVCNGPPPASVACSSNLDRTTSDGQIVGALSGGHNLNYSKSYHNIQPARQTVNYFNNTSLPGVSLSGIPSSLTSLSGSMPFMLPMEAAQIFHMANDRTMGERPPLIPHGALPMPFASVLPGEKMPLVSSQCGPQGHDPMGGPSVSSGETRHLPLPPIQAMRLPLIPHHPGASFISRPSAPPYMPPLPSGPLHFNPAGGDPGLMPNHIYNQIDRCCKAAFPLQAPHHQHTDESDCNSNPLTLTPRSKTPEDHDRQSVPPTSPTPPPVLSPNTSNLIQSAMEAEGSLSVVSPVSMPADTPGEPQDEPPHTHKDHTVSLPPGTSSHHNGVYFLHYNQMDFPMGPEQMPNIHPVTEPHIEQSVSSSHMKYEDRHVVDLPIRMVPVSESLELIPNHASQSASVPSSTENYSITTSSGSALASIQNIMKSFPNDNSATPVLAPVSEAEKGSYDNVATVIDLILTEGPPADSNNTSTVVATTHDSSRTLVVDSVASTNNNTTTTTTATTTTTTKPPAAEKSHDAANPFGFKIIDSTDTDQPPLGEPLTKGEYCVDCNKMYEEKCPTHKDMVYYHISDTHMLTRARMTLPKLLQLKCLVGLTSPNFTTVVAADKIEHRTIFGPLEGKLTTKKDLERPTETAYVWELFEDGRSSQLLDCRDENDANWLMFIKRARTLVEQNLVVYQRGLSIYFAACQDIEPETELLYWYGRDYARLLGVTARPGGYFCCPHCSRRYPDVHSMKQHMKHRHPDMMHRKFRCSMCPKAFTTSSKLNIHTLSHMGVKPHYCNYCGKQFTDPSNLRKHLKVHTGEKRFTCNVCGALFRQKAHLSSHMPKHTGEKRYECRFCKRLFARQSDLKTHENIHTHEKIFKCSNVKCNKVFFKLKLLQKHLKTHSAIKDWQCTKCQKTFQTKYHLQRHMGTCKGPPAKKPELNPQTGAELGLSIAKRRIQKRDEALRAQGMQSPESSSLQSEIPET